MASERKIQIVFKSGDDDDAWDRYQDLLKRAKKRALDKGEVKLASNDAEINRRLLGLIPPDWFVTKEDIAEFQGKKSKPGRGKARPGEAEDHPTTSTKKRANGNKD